MVQAFPELQTPTTVETAGYQLPEGIFVIPDITDFGSGSVEYDPMLGTYLLMVGDNSITIRPADITEESESPDRTAYTVRSNGLTENVSVTIPSIAGVNAEYIRAFSWQTKETNDISFLLGGLRTPAENFDFLDTIKYDIRVIGLGRDNSLPTGTLYDPPSSTTGELTVDFVQNELNLSVSLFGRFLTQPETENKIGDYFASISFTDNSDRFEGLLRQDTENGTIDVGTFFGGFFGASAEEIGIIYRIDGNRVQYWGDITARINDDSAGNAPG